MLKWIAVSTGLIGAGAAALMGTQAPPPGAATAPLTVIELYQSQGCSSCPPALKVLEAEAGRADVIALNFAVHYWDYLGWKDRFARPAYTARQWDYAKAAGRPQVATPQLIVNGSTAVNGGNKAEVDRAIATAARTAGGPAIGVRQGAVTIGVGPAAGAATVWLVSYDPRTIAVPIRAGENGGKTLPHRNIVTGLAKIGAWSGKPVTVALPAGAPGQRRAVLVQAGTGGPIVAAARVG